MRNIIAFWFLFFAMFINPEDEKIPRTVLVLPFFNQDLKNDSFGYLSEVLRDNMSSKLQTTDQFNYVDYIDIKKKILSLGYKIEDLRDDAKAVMLAMELKADIVIVGKFVALEQKVMIYARAYDIAGNQDVVSSVDGDSGIDIFTLIDELTKDMARKMALKYPKMNRKESSDALFLDNYSGIRLGTRYENVREAVVNSRYQYELYPKEKIIILKGTMNKAFRTKLTVYNFSDDNVLTNIWIMAGEVKSEEKRARIADDKNKMSRIFGHDAAGRENDSFYWEGEKYSFEVLNVSMFRGYNWFYYHYYTNDGKVGFEKINAYVSSFKQAVDFSIGGSVIPLVSEIKNAALLDKKDLSGDYSDVKRQSQFVFPVVITKFGVSVCFAFSYFYNNRNSVGFAAKAGYLPSVVSPLPTGTGSSSNHAAKPCSKTAGVKKSLTRPVIMVIMIPAGFRMNQPFPEIPLLIK